MDVEEGIYMFELFKKKRKNIRKHECKWCFCGGWALDLFMKSETRPHKDLDIMVFKKDLKETISYFKRSRMALRSSNEKRLHASWHWKLWKLWVWEFVVYEWNYPVDYLKVDEQGSCTFYQYEREIQDKVDFMEILLNTYESKMFVYRRNTDIRLAIEKAIYEFEGLPYLAPEIVLLYKSKYLSEDNQSDFDTVYVKLDEAQKMWLKNALTLEYGNDHPWVQALQWNMRQ